MLGVLLQEHFHIGINFHEMYFQFFDLNENLRECPRANSSRLSKTTKANAEMNTEILNI